MQDKKQAYSEGKIERNKRKKYKQQRSSRFGWVRGVIAKSTENTKYS